MFRPKNEDVVVGESITCRVIVDLMHAPGELLREGTEGALRYQRLGRHAFRALPSTARGWSTLLPKPKR